MAPTLRRRVQQAINGFLNDQGQRSSSTDKTMISKTSPTVWKYEMFRMEWTRRSVLRYLFEMLREDTRIRRANHVFASTAVRRGFDLRITSPASDAIASKAQKVAEDFIKRVKLNSKLAPWARALIRDGDLFLNPVIDYEKGQIAQIKSLPALTMQRNDDITGNFPDPSSAFQQIDPISLQPELELAEWQVNHIRYSYEEGERYGRSQYLGCLRSWKQLKMTEQDLVVRRRTRAAPRRVHILGSKDHPANDDDLQTYIADNKLDGSIKEIVTDFFMKGMGDIKDLNPDAMLDHIKDIIYLQEVYMIGSGVPLHVLGFGQNVNRDIIADQKAQFEEDVEELRSLLEKGDSGANSGIRHILDLEMALHGIDPTMLNYNIVWFENNNETANDRVARIIELRAAQPTPIISWKTALRIIAKDIGFDDQTAIEKEITDITDEMSEIAKIQNTLKTAPNPEQPASAPVTKEIVRSAGSMAAVQDSTEEGGVGMSPTINEHQHNYDGGFPLHDNPQLSQLQANLRQKITDHVGYLGNRFLNKNAAAVAKLSDSEPSELPVLDATSDESEENQLAMGMIYPILNMWDQEADEYKPAIQQMLYDFYVEVAKEVNRHAVDNMKHPAASKMLDQSMLNNLQFASRLRIDSILKTTKRLLAEQLKEGYLNKENQDQLVNRVKSVIHLPDWRAKTIARSEIAHAYNKSMKHTLTNLGYNTVQRIAQVDNKTCAQCLALNGTTYSVDEIPSDIESHPNCRCTIVPVS